MNMPSCVLRYCSNNSRNTNKTKGITFHQFPGPGHEKRETWIRFVQKNRSEETWLPSYHSRICSVHFKEEHKSTTKTGRTYLKKSAVPYDNTTKSDEPDLLEPLSEEVSSSESIFDTPEKIVMKKKLRMASETKKNLAVKYKKIKRQNIHLKKKCAYYKAIVQILRERFGLDLNFANDLMVKAEVVELQKSLMKKNKQARAGK